MLAVGNSSHQQLTFAKQFVHYQYPQRAERVGLVHQGSKVRIAYVSADFRQHPVAQLLVEVIELHNRNKFEIIGISLGRDDQSQVRARLAKAFDQFHDVNESSDLEVALLLKICR